MDKRLRTVGLCIKSAFCNWDEHNINDNMLSDIEVDLEHALAALREWAREEQDKRNAAWDAANPSPALIRAAKAQWAREAKERKGNLCGCGSGKRFLECGCCQIGKGLTMHLMFDFQMVVHHHPRGVLLHLHRAGRGAGAGKDRQARCWCVGFKRVFFAPLPKFRRV